MKNEQEFLQVVSALSRQGVLRHLVLIGSWVLVVYREHYPFGDFEWVTKDIDFLVKSPRGPFPKETGNILGILQEKGYKAAHSPDSEAEKYTPDIIQSNNELEIEFLCQPGRHVQDAFRVKGLGITAQPLQYQRVLLEAVVKLKYKGIEIDVPEPMVWAIHKIAISQLRTGVNEAWKMMNDLHVAGLVIGNLGDERVLQRVEQYKGKFLKLFESGWEKYQKTKVVDFSG